MGIKTLSKHKTSVTFRTLFIEVKSQSNQKVMAKQTFLTTLSIASVFKTGRYKFLKNEKRTKKNYKRDGGRHAFFVCLVNR